MALIAARLLAFWHKTVLGLLRAFPLVLMFLDTMKLIMHGWRQAFKVEHYEYFVSPANTFDAIPLLLESFDEPFEMLCSSTYFCAKLAKEHGVDILFAGDGGDELFAGNERYATQRVLITIKKFHLGFESMYYSRQFFLGELSKGWPFSQGKNISSRANIPYPLRLSSWGLLGVIPHDRYLQ